MVLTICLVFKKTKWHNKKKKQNKGKLVILYFIIVNTLLLTVLAKMDQ